MKDANPLLPLKEFNALAKKQRLPPRLKAMLREYLVKGHRKRAVSKASGLSVNIFEAILASFLPPELRHISPLIDQYIMRPEVKKPSETSLDALADSPVTAEEKRQIKELRGKKQTLITVAIATGIPEAIIRSISPPPKKKIFKPTRVQRDVAIRMRKDQATYTEISRATGIPIEEIPNILPDELRGRHFTSPQVTEAGRERVIELRKEGLNYGEIREKTGYNYALIAQLVPKELRKRQGGPLTSEHPKGQRVIELRKEGKTYKEIQADTGLSPVTISRLIPDEMKERRARIEVDKKLLGKIQKMAARGATYTEMTEATGLAYATLRKCLPERETRGRRKPVTDKERAKIIALRKKGLTFQAISDKTRLSSATVCRIAAEEFGPVRKRKKTTARKTRTTVKKAGTKRKSAA